MDIRNKIRRLSTVKTTYIIIANILITLTIILTIGFYYGVSHYMFTERRVEVTSLAIRLNIDLKALYRDALWQADEVNMPNAEKVLALNAVIQPLFDEISKDYPSYSIGYYDSRFDSIVAINPGSSAALFELPERKALLKSNESSNYGGVVEYYTSDGWKQQGSISVIIPVSVENETIGYVWIDTKTDDVYKCVLKYSMGILGLLIVLVVIPFLLTWFMISKINKQLISFAESLLKDDGLEIDTRFLPELTSVLKAAKAHSQQLRAYEAMVRNSNDSITTIDLDFKITSINPAGQKLYGYTPAEVLGQEITIISVPNEKQKLWEVLTRVKSGEEILSHEMQRQKKDGTVIDVSLTISPIRDDQGRISGIMGIHRDITEKKKMEAEMQKLDGLNLIGQMAASIAHEIRNPMTTVRGFLQLLGSKASLQEYRDYFELMIEELDRANLIITEFLSLSRNKPIALSEQNLNKIINKLLPMLRADALKNEATVIAEFEEIPNIKLNEQEIRQVILNLARNGLESMTSGGVITIKTFLEDGQVVITVSDQGSGIPTKVLENIGKPFFTTKENGTGLGLLVSYNIVYRHRGTISIRTGSGGTTFIIKLPWNYLSTSEQSEVKCIT